MNRRKKIKAILTKRSKQANRKANPPKTKPKYLSKAERAHLEAEATTNQAPSIDEASAPQTTDRQQN
ncbi:hypothetical protein MSP8887_02741 [Marinomonas spartinae]|uniref:DUF2986 domain-containing protein n=1 Tax=Marinomonas spartinae TaxID=1792290 RepID=A0A1A8TDS8_9GAMM|nr:DUF2986 domain-containing protein [Marinomonas spartinae]SBS30190.1 hypothetical protein MSP8886_01723 [Marinomonas spartinae]SBS36876.1 hypothetical protein MSP8887_02741 [Marinomonas spartinae]